MMNFIRHDLDPELVQAQVVKKISELEALRVDLKNRAVQTQAEYAKAVADGSSHLWPRPPQGDAYVDPMIDEWIDREQNYHALVRVLELPLSGKRFVLVYGDGPDSDESTGTGPFASFVKAASWFLKSGR